MAARPRKSSARVTLVLLGAAALSGCGSDQAPETRRDLYATREDCVADWGDAKECEEQQTRDGDRVTHRHWYGPSYSGGWTGPPRGVDSSHRGGRAVGSTTVARGGFGSSGHAHGAASS